MAIIFPNFLMQVNRRQWILLVMLFVASIVTVSLFNSENFSGSGSSEFGGLGNWNFRFQRKAGHTGNGNATGTDPNKKREQKPGNPNPPANTSVPATQTPPTPSPTQPAAATISTPPTTPLHTETTTPNTVSLEEQTCMDLEFKSCADREKKLEDCKTSLAQNPSYTPEQICVKQILNNTEITCFINFLVDCTEREGLLKRCKEKEGNELKTCNSKKGNELLSYTDGYDTYREKNQLVKKCVRRKILDCGNKKKEDVLCLLGEFKDCPERNAMLQTCLSNPDNRHKVSCNATTKGELQCQIYGFNDCSDKVTMLQKCQKSTKKVPCNATTKRELLCQVEGFMDCQTKENFLKTTTPAPTFPTFRSSSTAPNSDGDRLPAPLPQKDYNSGFSCKPKTEESEEFCGSLCEVLRRSVAKKPKSNTLEIAFGILFVILLLANVGLYLFRKAQDKRKKEKQDQMMKEEQKPSKGPVKRGFANKADYPALKPSEKKDKKIVPEPKVENIDEEAPSPPSPTNKNIKMRARLLKTQADLRKLRAHVKKRQAEHKSDTRSDKFQKKGPIFIPMEPDLPPPAVLPDNVVLDKVTYDPSGNEMYDIGSDVDDIEMDSSLVMDPSTRTEEEASRASKKASKMEAKKDKGKEKDKTTEDKKKDDK